VAVFKIQKMKLHIVLNSNWLTFPEKVKRIKEAFAKINFEITTLNTSFSAVPFIEFEYQGAKYKKIDPNWFKANIIKGGDIVALVLTSSQWIGNENWGYKDIIGETSVIGIKCDENEVFMYPNDKTYYSSFYEKLTHELAHYLIGLTNLPDNIHDLIKQHGPKWLEEFLKTYELPIPRPAEEKTNWFLAIINFLFKTTPEHKEDIIEIAEVYSPPKDRIFELALIMEAVETRNGDPKTLGVRYNNPGCLRFSSWQKDYGAVPGVNNFSKFPTYAQGKQAQLRLLRAACSGRMKAYNSNGTIKDFIFVYASSSPFVEKMNYTKRVVESMKISPAFIIKNFLMSN